MKKLYCNGLIENKERIMLEKNNHNNDEKLYRRYSFQREEVNQCAFILDVPLRHVKNNPLYKKDYGRIN